MIQQFRHIGLPARISESEARIEAAVGFNGNKRRPRSPQWPPAGIATIRPEDEYAPLDCDLPTIKCGAEEF